MPDDENLTGAPSPNGQTPPEPAPARRSIREVAEAAYDSLTADDDGGSEDNAEGDGQSSRPRDKFGRFAPKGDEPGEADGSQPTQPRLEQTPEGELSQPAPVAGSSIEAPAHWSAADKQVFAKAPPDIQAWALRRDSEMTADYQRKVQSTAQAAQFVNAIAPSFQHPAIAQAMRQEGIGPIDAVNRLMGFQTRMIDQDPRVRAGLMQDLMKISGLDPAAVFGLGRPGLSEQDQKDPAIKYITDHIGRTANEVQALRQSLFQMQANAQKQVDDENLRQTMIGIENFANEKDAQGRLVHPYFDDAINTIYALFKADPKQNINDVYKRAIWADETVREKVYAARRAAETQQQSLARAKQATRTNTRGITMPVAGGEREGPKGLRAAIEAAADEVGYGTA